MRQGTKDVRRRGAMLALVTLLALGATGCIPKGPVTVEASASLFPAFSTDIADYVNRCDPSEPTEVAVDADEGTTVSVDGQPARDGRFTVSVPQAVGRRFTLVVTRDGSTTTHSVRCLPPDFPRFEVERSPQLARGRRTAHYVTVPNQFPADGYYPAIFDDQGVPVWWGPKGNGLYATLLPDGNLAWYKDGAFEEHTLDGALVRTFGTVGQPADFHDLVVLPNGNHVMVTMTPRPGTDLRPWGGPASATIVDHIIQEVSPAGAVVWSWDTADHISIRETGPFWYWQQLADPGGPFSPFTDPFHYNSIAATADGYVVSFRHTDAVYKINRATGRIEWKLGGTLRPESLGFVGDPVTMAGGGAFGGQHDARILDDGTLTLYDNGSGRYRAPRALRYRLDLAGRKATLLTQATDPEVTSSSCCGSARVTGPDGNIVFGWGGNEDSAPDITEVTSSGERIFSLRFPDHTIYRAIPVPPKRLDAEALRQGMDAQYGAG